MTASGSGDGRGSADSRQSSGADPERVLAQALRAMAGDGRAGRLEPRQGQTLPRAPLSVLQIVLVATIFGLLIGITIGLVTLLV